MDNEDVFSGLGVEISFPNREDFLKIRETLTRMGIASEKGKKLYQSCHILHKKGRYAILHFKELFILDGKEKTTKISDSDISRRNTIVKMLESWNLLNIVSDVDIDESSISIDDVTVIPHKEKGDWELIQKYTIGSKK